ncbi:hypothetical protein TTHERM_00285640 (macronuclear) [Tetrahymena thermophila SB210]|uniref:Cyclic nucleotide-binding domain-containing protein n=1 Tax=Tetrahymena thermophila (strain SB210) TaxID=312017 RepID=I7M8K1_TETTS|nr:hypothetical protein TTHERM_00285640 [Tetrahymena thermophila SB210]EAR98333.1 hypothetical protein TTHERM_00285640 [Tetrahymena thermophila SB210]|eukprot:XP_001018578.1 hypothetical protein TTHERM_00285640 [Tetrahymena thermophila SB210]
MLEDPCQKVIRVIKEKQHNRDYTYEERVAILDFLVKSKFGEHYMGKISALHRLAYQMQYEVYEKGKTIYTNMDQIDKHYIILNGRVAILESKNIEQMNYQRQREQQFDYDRTLSQLQVNQQARQLKKRCELQQYDSFGFNLQLAQQNTQQYSQTSDHIVLAMENTHILILKAKIIQENNAENLQLNCKFVGKQLQVEYTLLNDIICEQCFKKKGMYICQESQNPRFIYCVLYGSVLYQDQSPAGTNRNRVVLGEGAIIGQSIKGEKQSNSNKAQNQISQKALSRQNSRYNGIQLDIQSDEKINEKEEQVQSSIHSSSDFTVILMIDKEKLGQKLIEYRRQQDYSINNSNKQQFHQSSQRSIQKPKAESSQVNDFNANIQQSRRQQRPVQEMNVTKGRLVFQKKSRSQSYSILCKLIQKEERSNSYSRNKLNFIELNPNYKKEYLAIEQPENKNRIQTLMEQSFYQNNDVQNSMQTKNLQLQANENNSNRNDFEDVVKRLAEKSVFPQYYQQEKKYNKLLMKNLKDREQIARLIIESKKPTYLPNYFSNPENFVNKDQLMNQFHTKYLHHSIKEIQNNHKQKRSYTHQIQSQNSTEYLENFNINSLQTEEEIDKFIQKINRQLIISETHQNQIPNKTSQSISNKNNNNNNNNNSVSSHNQQIINKQYTLGNLISEENMDLNQEQDKLNHLTVNSQQLFYPYRVQEMLDQFISLKNQESGQKNIECIEIRKSSIPQIKKQGQSQQEQYLKEEVFHNQNQNMQNNCNIYQDIAFESNQELQEMDVNYPSNDSFQNDQYLNQLEIREQDQNLNMDTDQTQNYEIMNYFTSNQVSRLGSRGNIGINQVDNEKGVLRSQSVKELIKKQNFKQEQLKSYKIVE